jgi:hypothetical protein
MNSSQIQQEAMLISNALPHTQLKIGSLESVLLLKVMLDSGAGINVCSRSYHETITKMNPHMVADPSL